MGDLTTLLFFFRLLQFVDKSKMLTSTIEMIGKGAMKGEGALNYWSEWLLKTDSFLTEISQGHVIQEFLRFLGRCFEAITLPPLLGHPPPPHL